MMWALTLTLPESTTSCSSSDRRHAAAERKRNNGSTVCEQMEASSLLLTSSLHTSTPPNVHATQRKSSFLSDVMFFLEGGSYFAPSRLDPAAHQYSRGVGYVA